MTDEADEGARPGAREYCLRFGTVAVLLAADLWSKAAVFAALDGGSAEMVRDCACGHSRLPLLGEQPAWFSFMLSENPGAAWGFGAGFSPVLVVARILAGIGLSWMLLRSKRGRRWFTLCLILILGGALGNLYDNLTRHYYVAAEEGGQRFVFGKVRDFIDVYFSTWDWHFPTFNVADSCISVGAVLLLLISFRGEHDGEVAQQPTDGTPPVADTGDPS